ncbi:mannose-6-phosphate isomerase, type 2 / mannose-1-phosphate guanylyltransferase (GDP) [Magnetococcus marinus MC-1]|uniref:mannose-1-phosphate guanylyltransferase n=1 Tax=Magnetococcus marinus (strain ATCC BAA-1437 / JCM 17883 / MC-1) TaxID=156889 RepID=A0L639_MAGMM|nr:mannose-1-phosphate guanylyltransferase/mannose-6-phosphate isomerase [Magnetococcus marinus]ABK43432.1 mannose-6-phosphate isomerase, type 2 / mannose-1-phosphate guanylyltransferase (GDP) [Magnetococcus marinus MC-1]
MLIPTILAGGGGTRLWPLSRDLYPKQFHSGLGDDRPLLLQTAARVQGLPHLSDPVVICNEQHRFMVEEMLREEGNPCQAIFLEPVGRNTAPAAAIAALYARTQQADALVLLMPSDHHIVDSAGFRACVEQGMPHAANRKLVTFGIVPHSPNTGYGYIRRGEPLAEGVFQILNFTEKPNASTAQAYLEQGDYSWNSGIFLFHAGFFLETLARLAPAMYDTCLAAFEAAQPDHAFTRLGKAFLAVPADSIDYAVMEKSNDGVVIPMGVGWNDMGAWDALWEVGNKDPQHNLSVGDTLSVDTHNSLIWSSSRLVATVGVENLAIVETADAILVARKDRVQEVKKIVDQLKQSKRCEFSHHNMVYRPWGTFTQVDAGPRFQVKRIMVKPGAKLSLQMHHHRSEHWVVVKGTALVTRGDTEILLKENESTYIPLGVKHSLANPGKIPLEIIEVQSGPYLGEDDIIRFEDIYARLEDHPR